MKIFVNLAQYGWSNKSEKVKCVSNMMAGGQLVGRPLSVCTARGLDSFGTNRGTGEKNK